MSDKCFAFMILYLHTIQHLAFTNTNGDKKRVDC